MMPQRAVQVVIVDQMPDGPFLSFWQRVGAPHRTRQLTREPFPPGTCFRMALHNAMVHGNTVHSRWGG